MSTSNGLILLLIFRKLLTPLANLQFLSNPSLRTTIADLGKLELIDKSQVYIQQHTSYNLATSISQLTKASKIKFGSYLSNTLATMI